jgi:UDP-N-acetylglucosamine transferase subunit ALG13
VLVPREHRFGEHVDDHQRQIADRVSGRGLAVTAAADQVTLDDLERAAGLAATSGPAPPLALAGRLGRLLHAAGTKP